MECSPGVQDKLECRADGGSGGWEVGVGMEPSEISVGAGRPALPPFVDSYCVPAAFLHCFAPSTPGSVLFGTSACAFLV